MNMLDRGITDADSLMRAIAAAWPVATWRGVHVLVAASGGPDSMALVRGLLALKREAGGAGRLFVGHVNHQLRGEESDADERWLADQCTQLGLELLTRRDDTAAAAREQGDGVEAAARAARYRLLTEMAESIGARFVAVGHTLDDQAETVLFRLMRGTGLRGLAGIPRSRSMSRAVTLVRPLLGVRRAEVEDYLLAHGQAWRTDATNGDRRFARNRIRHGVLPRLSAEFGGDAGEALARLGEQAAEALRIVESAAGTLLERCDVRTTSSAAGGRAVTLRTAPLIGEPDELVREALRIVWRNAGFGERAMTRRGWIELAAAAIDEHGAPLNLPGGVATRRDDGRLTLERA